MTRRTLSAIEIAEGALLADVAVIFQLIWMYLPVVGLFFRVLIPIVFTVVVLRRNLYAGIMALCVALFIAGVITGPNIIDLIYLLLEGIGGLFLGVMMKRRAPDIAILLLGTTGLAVALYGLIFFLALLFGTPLADILRTLHRDYAQAVAAVGSAMSQVGLGGWWRQGIYPLLNSVVNLAFAYWWALLFVENWAVALPVNIFMYYVTNVFARLLGYDVRPFPGGKIDRLIRWITRRLVRQGIKRGLLKPRVSRGGAVA